MQISDSASFVKVKIMTKIDYLMNRPINPTLDFTKIGCQK